MKRTGYTLLFLGSAFATVVTLSGRDALASWWVRIPAAQACQADPGFDGTVGMTSDGLLQINSTSALGVNLVCGMTNVNVTQTNATFTMYDSNIGTTSTISVDMFDLGGSGIAANSLSAEACRFSSWTHTCGTTTTNTAIGASGHLGMTISDKSAWTNDAGPGYAYIALAEAGNTESWIAGIYVTT